ncbi:MAG TPA: QueT transporter family protein [Clostridiaceae bacterium]|nr:QueT transporter family protein [Clostridiaceae bacterium]
MNRKHYNLIFAGVLAGLYLVLTLPFAQIASGMIQFRLAEAITVLPALTPAAIPGVFLGCLLANFLNLQNLGPIDIFGGSLTTLLAAYLTYVLAKPLRRYLKLEESEQLEEIGLRKYANISRIVSLIPPVILNGLIVGTYLPFLFSPETPAISVILTTILSITVSQTIVIFGLGLPLLIGLSKNKAILNYI